MPTIRKVQAGLVWIVDGDVIVARTISELAEYLQITPTTVRRWLRGQPIPRAARLALRHLVGKFHSSEWGDFHVGEDGRLWSRNGFGFTPAELEHFSVIMQTNRVLWRVQREKADPGRADEETGETTGTAAPLSCPPRCQASRKRASRSGIYSR